MPKEMESFGVPLGARGSKYSIDKAALIDGRVWRLSKDEHLGTPRKCGEAIRVYAAMHGKKLRTRIQGDDLIVQAVPR